jgi:type II restriction/modification system DNA methylase subunit YeeA
MSEINKFDEVQTGKTALHKSFKTPQEKKRLSYAKDCRRSYGESDKGSRKSIRRNKTFPNRAFRKNINDVLHGAIGEVDLEKAETIDVKAKQIKRRKWKKWSDRPLGEAVKDTVEDRGKIFTAKIKRRIKASYTYREK